MKKLSAVILSGTISLILIQPLTAQNTLTEPVKLSYTGSGGYSLVERTNLLRYDNGKYTGLTSREVRSFISPSENPYADDKDNPLSSHRFYNGSFYVLEATKRAGENAAAGVHDSIPSRFHISKEGQVAMVEDNGYPSFRSFPAFTSENVFPGAQWSASAIRSVDPLNKGKFTKLEMLVLYTFVGKEIYREHEVYRIKADWQTSYGGTHTDLSGDRDLQRAGGGHKADILILVSTGEPILVMDKVDETFVYKDGSQVRFKGTISLFTEFPPAIEREKILPALNRIAFVEPGTHTSGAGSHTSITASAAKNNMIVEQTSAGLRLSMRNILFSPNSDQLLSSEYERLDKIAEVLKLAPESQFLVEGHTARAGESSDEIPLSQKRARRVAEELIKLGVSENAFITRGWGSSRPIASNDTEEGRAQNRRVEITILE